eukprot:gene13489-15892_t
MNLKIVCLFTCLLCFMAKAYSQTPAKEITILYTNDFHSAFDPVPAYWLKDSPKLGGAGQLSTMIGQLRAKEKNTFLFDAGDMFTGMLSNVSQGELLMEMMMSMHYDAMGIGNHEFDYGSKNFLKQINRVPFPVLGANIFYKGTEIPYARPYTILEKNGIRLGVIGIVGLDAFSVLWQEGSAGLEFRDPVPITQKIVAELKPQVDLIVVLAHQGKTGPQQTDAEARPEVQRDVKEDIDFCSVVPGIDIYIGGHAHKGMERPYKEPVNGALIVQTYGYGTRLGYLKVLFKDKKITSYTGELLKVWSDRYPADSLVQAKINAYKEKFAPQIGIPLGSLKNRLVRDYMRESSLGCFIADVIRETTNTDVAFENAGGLRADLPQGTITNGNVLDAVPFFNTLSVLEMTGKQIKEVLEQSFSLERGMMQVSGLKAWYDLKKPVGKRLVRLQIGSALVQDSKIYRVGTNSFIADGGDLYQTFHDLKKVNDQIPFSTVIMDHIKKTKIIQAPEMNRLIPVKN